MPKSYRIRTSVDGLQDTDKTIRVQVDQDFDFLEVLSLKLTQSDVYQRYCSDYGVVIGRVVANGGYGVPNAKVSVFVPLDELDESDPVISTLYPYKDISAKNEDGFRYNLLPYKPSYDGHVATGTFPTREDVLTRKEVLSIYEKYYKYTVKTNESGDYMIVGVPLGNQTIFLDVDLSDMGCFSLRPTDLIRMGRATEKQFNGNQFRSSSDLASLPQLVTQAKTVSVSSFWGVGDQCDIGITRVDFDLRDSNIVIEPVSTFMGSIMSSNKNAFLKLNCKPATEQGDLCGMITKPGRILAIRQTINSDENGDPILEQYQLEQGGKVIDENGAYVVDVPMNLDYVTTNEFGELVLSNDPSIGIPTKGKYRFKFKWEDGKKDIGAIQSANSIIGPDLINLSAFNPKGNLERANYLVPNIKEYGWSSGVDPNEIPDSTLQYVFSDDELKTQEIITTSFPSKTTLYLDKIEGEYTKITFYKKETGSNDFEEVKSRWITLLDGGVIKMVVDKKLKSITFASGTQNLKTYRTVRLTFKNMNYDKVLLQKSYSFSLDWDDYPNKDEAISCRDFFYEFTYNKVYTTAQLIDEYRAGTNRGRFLSIKEILERSCESEVNKFPINDGVRNFDLLYFIVSILFLLFGIIGSLFLISYHIIKFLWNNFAPFIVILISGIAFRNAAQETIAGVAAIVGSAQSFGATALLAAPFFGKAILWTALGISLLRFIRRISKFKFPSLRLPMITYPDCSSCDCGDDNTFGVDLSGGDVNTSPLADLTSPGAYECSTGDDIFTLYKNLGLGQITAGRNDVDNQNFARTPSYNIRNDNYWWSSVNMPIPERINVYNTKGHYFNNPSRGAGSNRIKVFPNYPKNAINKSLGQYKFYEDQPLVLLLDADQANNFTTGQLLSFINPLETKDINILSASTISNELNTYSVTGTTIASGSTTINISYANPNNPSALLSPVSFVVEQTLFPQEKASYTFPSDIEYYQVITGITVSEVEKIVSKSTKNTNLYDSSFYRRVLTGIVDGNYRYKEKVEDANGNKSDEGRLSCGKPAIQQIQGYEKLVVMVLMKGVDPYTTRQQTKVDISLPLGLREGQLVVESNYKLNIPIQPGLRLTSHDQVVSNTSTNLYYNSYVFTPSSGTGLFKYSGYTTNNHRLYSSFDSTHYGYVPNLGVNSDGYYTVGPKSYTFSFGGYKGPNTLVGSISDPWNQYFSDEYVEGGSLMWVSRSKDDDKLSYNEVRNGDKLKFSYERAVYEPSGKTLNMVSNSKIVMRTDRLPRSSSFDNDFVLAQNNSFSFFAINDNGIGTEIQGSINFNSDFSFNQAADLEESYGSSVTSVMTSFNCNKMVPIGAYRQTPEESITLAPPDDPVYFTSGDKEYPIVVNGCYRLVEKELAIRADLKSFAEWRSRFLMGFALCRNVFGMTFTNQWINGVLYMPGFQLDKRYPIDKPNDPNYVYCTDKIVFREENNSFFYRSSPYNEQTDQFVGMATTSDVGNEYFLGNPTTVLNLGPKDNIIKFVCAKPEFQGYNMDRLEVSTFQSIGDLTQFFIISRLANASFLQKLVSLNGGLAELFSREGQKIDGDFAQLTSINSELGVVPFSPDTYKDSSLFFNATPEPIVGVFFTGETIARDFITPGREIFIDTPTKFANNLFGLDSQRVPMYKWKLEYPSGTKQNIFGSQFNNWATNRTDFYITPYQGIDRLNDSTYFKSDVKNPTSQRPGYIYNSVPLSGSNGIVTGFTYSAYTSTNSNDKFIVGAPFHFYFGLKVGKTAYDIFVRKNLIDL